MPVWRVTVAGAVRPDDVDAFTAAALDEGQGLPQLGDGGSVNCARYLCNQIMKFNQFNLLSDGAHPLRGGP